MNHSVRGALALPAADTGSSSSEPNKTASTVILRQPTTTRELALVLGYTFHAHSCAAQIAYIRTGWSPERQRRNGVDQAMYA